MYFVTMCTKNRQNILWAVGATFGRPPSDDSHLSYYGHLIDQEIKKIDGIYENTATVDKYIIMPNHLHLMINLQNGASGRPKVAPTIGRIVQQFKGSISKQIGQSIWQKLYYDHVIRCEEEYLKVWNYIDTNAMEWAEDRYYVK